MTTARQIFKGLLVELSKVNAPSMLLGDFNYFLNKAILQYINRRYALYDMSLQTTDDLRVLKATAELTPVIEEGNSTYTVLLPLDYMHMLNCICQYYVNQDSSVCEEKGLYVLYIARRLTADAKPMIMSDYYQRPLPRRPYFYINNVNKSLYLPTNPINNTDILNSGTKGTDAKEDYVIELDTNNLLQVYSNLPRTISLDGFTNKSIVNREAGARYGNKSNIRMEIIYGSDINSYVLKKVYIDYIKTPLYIDLRQELINLIDDLSLVMEFPDHACYEIMNELVRLVMDNIQDPRLNTHIAVTETVGAPVQSTTPAALSPAPKYHSTTANTASA